METELEKCQSCGSEEFYRVYAFRDTIKIPKDEDTNLITLESTEISTMEKIYCVVCGKDFEIGE